MRYFLFYVLVTLLGFGASVGAQPAPAKPMLYVYPPPESGADKRMGYYWELLDAALHATSPKWGAYVLQTGAVVMNADRSQIMLSQSQDITMLVRTTSMEREKVVLPLRIPLDKGLTGYRLFLIQKPTQARLNNVRTLNDLKAFSIGQGAQWVDADILRSAGLTVEPGSNYDSLFKMLQVGRFDLFSRGVNEISQELNDGRARNPDLVIEENLMLYYPLPRYFFFARTPEGERLSQRVEEGLRILIKNGDFEKRYQVFKRQILAGLKLSGRRTFKIDNPTLSPETPLQQREYWDTLAAELK
jgi:hypothetical protein